MPWACCLKILKSCHLPMTGSSIDPDLSQQRAHQLINVDRMKKLPGVKEAEATMDAIHQIIDGRILNQVITLPKPMQDMFVEIIIRPAKKQAKPTLTRNELRKRLSGSHTELLSGAIQTNMKMTLRELRAERRLKYERVD